MDMRASIDSHKRAETPLYQSAKHGHKKLLRMLIEGNEHRLTEFSRTQPGYGSFWMDEIVNGLREGGHVQVPVYADPNALYGESTASHDFLAVLSGWLAE